MKNTWKLHYTKRGFTQHIVQSQFVKKNHYSRSLCRGTKYIFTIYENGHILGVAAFGEPTGRNCQQKYSENNKPILELKRLCLINSTPKNSESWFIAKCLNFLKKTNKYSGVLSYADPNYGHIGIIYKAANFTYLGKQKQGSTRVIINGHKISAASARAKFNFSIGTKMVMVYDKLKHIYFYSFNRK